jgi:hypothetical protein
MKPRSKDQISYNQYKNLSENEKKEFQEKQRFFMEDSGKVDEIHVDQLENYEYSEPTILTIIEGLQGGHDLTVMTAPNTKPLLHFPWTGKDTSTIYKIGPKGVIYEMEEVKPWCCTDGHSHWKIIKMVPEPKEKDEIPNPFVVIQKAMGLYNDNPVFGPRGSNLPIIAFWQKKGPWDLYRLDLEFKHWMTGLPVLKVNTEEGWIAATVPKYREVDQSTMEAQYLLNTPMKWYREGVDEQSQKMLQKKYLEQETKKIAEQEQKEKALAERLQQSEELDASREPRTKRGKK